MLKSILRGVLCACLVAIPQARAQSPSEQGAGALSGYVMIKAFAKVCKFTIEAPIAGVLDGNMRAIVEKFNVPAGATDLMMENSFKQLSGHDAETCVWGPDKFNAMIAEMAKEPLAAAAKAGVQQAQIPPSKMPLSAFPAEATADVAREKARAGIGGYMTIMAIAKLCDLKVEPEPLQVLVANVNALQPKSGLSDKELDGVIEAIAANFAKEKQKYCGPGQAGLNEASVSIGKSAAAAAEGSGVTLAPIPAVKTVSAPAAPAAPAAKPAGDLVLGADPDAILAIASKYGEATLGKDRDGDPQIKLRTKGIGWQISFYGCDKGANCTSIKLYHGFETSDKPTLERANEWNRTKRWAKAYIDKDGDPNIGQDINLRNGVTRANLDSTLATWVDVMSDFKAFIAKK